MCEHMSAPSHANPKTTHMAASDQRTVIPANTISNVCLSGCLVISILGTGNVTEQSEIYFIVFYTKEETKRHMEASKIKTG